MTLTETVARASPFSWLYAGLSGLSRHLGWQNRLRSATGTTQSSPSNKSDELERILHSYENPVVRRIFTIIAVKDSLGTGTISLEQAADDLSGGKSARRVAKLLNHTPCATAYGSGDSKGLYHAGFLHAELVFDIRSMSVGTSAGGYAAANAAKLKHSQPLNGAPLSLAQAQEMALELYGLIKTQSFSFPGSVALDKMLNILESSASDRLASFGRSSRSIRESLGESYQAARLIRRKGALRDDKPLKEFLASFAGNEKIGAYPGFHTVYTDYRHPNQRQVVHWDEHSDLLMHEVLYRTMAAPPLFAPTRTQNSIMADGGIVEPVPIRTAYQDCGAQIVIAVPLQCYAPVSDFNHEGISGVFYHIGRVFHAAMRERTLMDIERYSRASFEYMVKAGCSPTGNMILNAPNIEGKGHNPFLLNDPVRIIEQGSSDTIQLFARTLNPRYAPSERANADFYMNLYNSLISINPVSPSRKGLLAIPYLNAHPNSLEPTPIQQI